MNESREILSYIPLDKSWIIRIGILDIVNRYRDIERFLSTQEILSDDLLALKRAAESWATNAPVYVGESGTLYRLLRFASWKLNLHKSFITQGTLMERNITNDPGIVNLPQKELLKFDNETSQWASASVLLGDPERLPNPPFKLALTYEAVEHWNEKRKAGFSWESRYDETIKKQAEVFLKLLNDERPAFAPLQAEDFCFAYTFDYMTAEEGEKQWPALRGHESDRIIEIQETLKAVKEGKEIHSKDHRVVQAIAMWGKVNNKPVHILYPESVNKSWPQFWDFLNSN